MSTDQEEQPALARAQPLEGPFCRPGFDAVFHAGHGLATAAPAWYPPDRLEAHWAHSLLRDPEDVACHTQRIGYWSDQGNVAHLAAAIVDLLLTLRGRHTVLRQRMLQLADHQLPTALVGVLSTPTLLPPEVMKHSLFAGGPAYPDGPNFAPNPSPGFIRNNTGAANR